MRPILLLLSLAAPLPAAAQSFIDSTASLPGGANNNSSTENLDFADVDGDGDWDVLFADGGDGGNDRNRIWVNQGGLQGGTLGVFVDETSTRLPTIQDTSRDVDFADIDRDGDPDVYVSNTSSTANQSSRWWINVGGAQGGTPGFFSDQTDTRWVDLGVNNGSTVLSSVSPSFVLAGGGFIDWACDAVFADLDADGDPDLVHTSYGPVFQGTVPSRLFLNDGAGQFTEFNPSGFQLLRANLADLDPALWCEGVQMHDTMNTSGAEADIAGTPLGVEPGDLDGDFDLDILQGARGEQPRLFENRTAPGGGPLVPFRDVTYARFAQFVPGFGQYEQELGDFDDDGDLDLYGVNWATAATFDATLRNDGSGSYGPFAVVPESGATDNEADWFDYDADGDLDVFVASFSGQDRLYQNQGAPAYALTNVTSSELPALAGVTLGADACDVDDDGDTDVFTARDNFSANQFLENVTGVPDASAPRIPLLEQAPDRTGQKKKTGVRAHVYDNASWDVTQYVEAQLVYALNGGPSAAMAMTFSGGQVFRGEVPAALYGTIQYRVEAIDDHGNAGVSGLRTFTSAPESYCTAGISASGCQATLSALGAPSASAPSGFVVSAAGVEGNRSGLFYFGTSGRIAFPWGNGSSFKCVAPPTSRGGLLAGSGTNGVCDGAFSQDLNARWTLKPSQNPGPGSLLQVQLWHRDPLNTSNQPTGFSDALELLVGP